MKKKVYAWIGAATAVASTAMIIGYALRKNKNDAVCTGVLLAGIAGLLGGALIAHEPARKQKTSPSARALSDEADALLCEESMAKLLTSDETVAEESETF